MHIPKITSFWLWNHQIFGAIRDFEENLREFWEEFSCKILYFHSELRKINFIFGCYKLSILIMFSGVFWMINFFDMKKFAQKSQQISNNFKWLHWMNRIRPILIKYHDFRPSSTACNFALRWSQIKIKYARIIYSSKSLHFRALFADISCLEPRDPVVKLVEFRKNPKSGPAPP